MMNMNGYRLSYRVNSIDEEVKELISSPKELRKKIADLNRSGVTVCVENLYTGHVAVYQPNKH